MPKFLPLLALFLGPLAGPSPRYSIRYLPTETFVSNGGFRWLDEPGMVVACQAGVMAPSLVVFEGPQGQQVSVPVRVASPVMAGHGWKLWLTPQWAYWPQGGQGDVQIALGGVRAVRFE